MASPWEFSYFRARSFGQVWSSHLKVFSYVLYNFVREIIHEKTIWIGMLSWPAD